MADAPLARWRGDLYQGRVFWAYAARLFLAGEHVAEVRFEDSEAPGFDDVTVRYDPAIPGEDGSLVTFDRFQTKFHQDYRRAVTADALVDPAFVNNSRQSLLHALMKARTAAGPAGSRYIAITPWMIEPSDVLARLVTTDGGRLDLERLVEGKTDASPTGRARLHWCRELGLSEDALLALLQPFRLRATAPDLVSQLDDLNRWLRSAGMAPISLGQEAVTYDSLLQQLRMRGQKAFDAESMRTVLERHRLWVGAPAPTPVGRIVAVRSFLRGTENLEGRPDEQLDLTSYFEGRALRGGESWNGSIGPTVSTFAAQLSRSGQNCELHLNAHMSIAFLLGFELDTKSGIKVIPVQRGLDGPAGYRPSASTDRSATDPWDVQVQPARATGDELALAVSVTHRITDGVAAYVRRATPRVSEILVAVVRPAPGRTAVRDGAHALQLADALVARVREIAHGRRVHLFVAGPNALTFRLGQLWRVVGPTQLYEHDLESGRADAYTPSIRVPIALTSTSQEESHGTAELLH